MDNKDRFIQLLLERRRAEVAWDKAKKARNQALLLVRGAEEAAADEETTKEWTAFEVADRVEWEARVALVAAETAVSRAEEAGK